MRLRALVPTCCLVILTGCAPIEPEPPAHVELAVPFVVQAPTAVWQEPWENACEETSIFMVDSYYRGIEPTIQDQLKGILTILQLKNDRFGASLDESTATMSHIIDALAGSWTTTRVERPSRSVIMQTLADGHPIIAPVYAPELLSSLYPVGGPDYHVVVLIGYDRSRDELILHDPGTAHGASVRVSMQAFLDALHDLGPHPHEYTGTPRILLTTPIIRSSQDITP